MASSSQPLKPYHVFLSFRGPDGRDNVVSHFNTALVQAGIHTYLDEDELKTGERVSVALPNAIENSRIALIIFSKHYATSLWCLKEVAKIMECKDTNRLVVLPLFLKVEPREVRGAPGSYQIALDKLKKKCEDGEAVNFCLADVEDWNKALEAAGGLSGWVYSDGVITEVIDGTAIQSGSKKFKDEAELVRVIVKDISKRLERIPLYVAKDTVGMLSQLDEVISILNMRSPDEVQDECLMIGLWGMGGIGKSTLAKILYNFIFKDFIDAAFYDGIPRGDENLRVFQERMLHKLTNVKIGVTNPHEGIATMKDRLQSKRVLLILDGVDDISQINDLIGKEHNYFGKGSRIIVTTRNKSVLGKNWKMYEVKALKDHQARELFRRCASRNGNVEISGDHEGSALQCTRRLPLALDELGCAYGKKSHDKRGDILEKFPTTSYDRIHKELKKSYDGLEEKDMKEIFLDIACFFNGWNRYYVEGVLGICYIKSCEEYGCYDDVCSRDTRNKVNEKVQDLIGRSLITDENGTLQVHPLIELMGQTIEKEKSPRNLAKRERLWCRDDVVKVLSRDEGKFAVQAIVFSPEEREVIINTNPFKKLTKLRFLIMTNVKLETSSPHHIDLPDELRWFEWPECPASCLKTSSYPSLNPAVLAVRRSLSVRNKGKSASSGQQREINNECALT